VLGKGRRAPRAWELALLGARPPARPRQGTLQCFA